MNISLVRKFCIVNLVLGIVTFAMFIAFLVMTDTLKVGLDPSKPTIYLVLLFTLIPGVASLMLAKRIISKTEKN